METPTSPTCKPPKGLRRPVPIDPKGLDGPTKAQAAGPGWRRTSWGLYVRADAPDLVEQRIIEQAARLPPGGAVTGWAALRLAGGAYFGGTVGEVTRPVQLVAHRQLLAGSGAVALRGELGDEDTVSFQNTPCACPCRALVDEARQLRELREAVVAIDMAAAAELVSGSELRDFLASRPGLWGRSLITRALTLATEDSDSPQESRMRLVWLLDAGLPEPLCNRDIFGLDGQFLGRPDLLDPVAGVVGEYDGSFHNRAKRRRKDVAREERFRDHGLEYFSVVAGDLHDVPAVVRRMLGSRARARGLSPERRRWTLEPPHDWESRMSLDDRRAQDSDLRRAYVAAEQKTLHLRVSATHGFEEL